MSIKIRELETIKDYYEEAKLKGYTKSITSFVMSKMHPRYPTPVLLEDKTEQDLTTDKEKGKIKHLLLIMILPKSLINDYKIIKDSTPHLTKDKHFLLFGIEKRLTIMDNIMKHK